MLGKEGEGFDAVATGEDAVAGAFEEFARGGEDAGLVIDDEDGLALTAGEGFLLGAWLELRIGRGGEEAGEGGAFADFTGDLEEAVVALGDS